MFYEFALMRFCIHPCSNRVSSVAKNRLIIIRFISTVVVGLPRLDVLLPDHGQNRFCGLTAEAKALAQETGVWSCLRIE
jgi:hypothetical protein